MRALEPIIAVLLGTLAATALLDRYDPPQQLPLVTADYPICVRVNPGPLIHPKRRVNGAPISELS